MRVDKQKYKDESASFLDRIRDVVMSSTCWRGAIHPNVWTECLNILQFLWGMEYVSEAARVFCRTPFSD